MLDVNSFSKALKLGRLRKASNTSSSTSLSSSVTCAVGDSPSLGSRLQKFREELQDTHINVSNLRKLALHGVPDQDGLRALTWKLLLGYLPYDKGEWKQQLEQKRREYKQFCEELIIDPSRFTRDAGTRVPLVLENDKPVDLTAVKHDVTHDDHPLSLGNDSKWAKFFQDAEVLEQIERDVMRTHPDMHFFSGDDGDAVLHRQEMKRALFLFAKLNPGLTYVQGMNELYAPLYYMFRTDPDKDASQHAEADAFYCFVDLISEFRDHFCQQLDNSSVGIKATLTQLNTMLHAVDPELCHHLEVKNKVNPQFYAFRWITLILTQEFPFPDAVRLWDTVLSDPRGRSDCLLRLCIAMLINVREELLQGDFAHNLKLLQRYPPVDVHAILHKASEL